MGDSANSINDRLVGSSVPLTAWVSGSVTHPNREEAIIQLPKTLQF